LSETLIKLTAPGILDIYEGSGLWDLRLVDPDNREPVDFEARRRLLRVAMTDHGGGFMSLLAEGGPKLRLIATTLAVRARNPDAYAIGSGYQRLVAIGSRSEHS